MSARIPRIRLSREVEHGNVVARDGVVLCFFLPHSHSQVAPAIWQALETYRRAIPPEALAWYVSDEGDCLPLDEKGWAQIRYTLRERSEGYAWHVELEEDCSHVKGYTFEYAGLWLNDPEGLNREGPPRQSSSPCPPNTSKLTALAGCARWRWNWRANCPSALVTSASRSFLPTAAGSRRARTWRPCCHAIWGWISIG